MATPTLSVFHLSWDRDDAGGQKTVYGRVTARYDPDVDPVAEWTQASVEAALDAGGYALDDACPTEATARLRDRSIKIDPEAHHIFRCKLVYKTETSDDNERPTNDEQAPRYSTVHKTVQAYYDQAGVALDAEDGRHGAPMRVPMTRILVSRIHTTSRESTWSSYRDKVNSDATYTTPGGVQIASAAKQLLFEGADEEQLENGKYRVNYVFLKDGGRYNAPGPTVYDLLHREPVAPLDRETGQIKATVAEGTLLKDIFEQTSFTALMADE